MGAADKNGTPDASLHNHEEKPSRGHKKHKKNCSNDSNKKSSHKKKHKDRDKKKSSGKDKDEEQITDNHRAEKSNKRARDYNYEATKNYHDRKESSERRYYSYDQKRPRVLSERLDHYPSTTHYYRDEYRYSSTREVSRDRVEKKESRRDKERSRSRTPKKESIKKSKKRHRSRSKSRHKSPSKKENPSDLVNNQVKNSINETSSKKRSKEKSPSLEKQKKHSIERSPSPEKKKKRSRSRTPIKETDYYKNNIQLLEIAKNNLARFLAMKQEKKSDPNAVKSLKAELKANSSALQTSKQDFANKDNKSVSDFIELCKQITNDDDSTSISVTSSLEKAYFSSKFVKSLTESGNKINSDAAYTYIGNDQLALTYIESALNPSISEFPSRAETVTKLFPVSSGTQHREVELEKKDEIDDKVFVRTSLEETAPADNENMVCSFSMLI